MSENKKSFWEKVRNSVWTQLGIKTVAGIILGGLLWWIEHRWGVRFSWLILGVLWGGVWGWTLDPFFEKKFIQRHRSLGLSQKLGGFLGRGMGWMGGLLGAGLTNPS